MEKNRFEFIIFLNIQNKMYTKLTERDRAFMLEMDQKRHVMMRGEGTWKELERDYCIYDGTLYLKQDIVNKDKRYLKVWNPTPYDLWNHDAYDYNDPEQKRYMRLVLLLRNEEN